MVKVKFQVKLKDEKDERGNLCLAFRVYKVYTGTAPYMYCMYQDSLSLMDQNVNDS
jgi:hypothetical protein